MRRSCGLAGDLVVAGFAAALAVVEAVFAEADVELSLAEDAVFFAFAAFFGLLADAAVGFDFGGHGGKCSVGLAVEQVTVVMGDTSSVVGPRLGFR